MNQGTLRRNSDLYYHSHDRECQGRWAAHDFPQQPSGEVHFDGSFNIQPYRSQEQQQQQQYYRHHQQMRHQHHVHRHTRPLGETNRNTVEEQHNTVIDLSSDDRLSDDGNKRSMSSIAATADRPPKRQHFQFAEIVGDHDADEAVMEKWECTDCGNSYRWERLKCRCCKTPRDDAIAKARLTPSRHMEDVLIQPVGRQTSGSASSMIAILDLTEEVTNALTSDKRRVAPKKENSGKAKSKQEKLTSMFKTASRMVGNSASSSSPSSRSSPLSWSSSLSKAGKKTSKKKVDIPDMPDEPPLSSEQRETLEKALEGDSMFCTGNAGTGKSTLLRVMIRALQAQHGESKVAVTASTGAAATLLSGCTIHSWSGVGIGRESAEDLATRVLKNKASKKRWTQAKVLVVDECSMVEPELFDKLEYIGRTVRPGNKPFGGLQVVLVGDFFQLPPVSKSGPVKFCFEAKKWPTVIKRSVVLKNVFRQRNQDFVRVLNELRSARLSADSVSKLESAAHHDLSASFTGTDPPPEPTRLFAHNQRADTMNAKRLHELSGVATSFQAMDTGESGHVREQFAKNCQAPTRLDLKIGTPVLLLKNLELEAGLCNGSRGTVIGFDQVTPGNDPSSSSSSSSSEMTDGNGGNESEIVPIVEFTKADGSNLRRTIGREEFSMEQAGRVIASRSQLPLKLAWAISIHKSQGMSIDFLEVDLSGCFEYGQAYVALSRATSFEHLKIINFNKNMVKAHPKVISMYERLGAL